MWNAKGDIRGLKISVLEKIGYAENPEMILPTIKMIDEVSEDRYGI